MRKLLTVVVYTIIVLLIGRNLTMLPRFYIFTTHKEEQDKFASDLKQQTKKLISGQPGIYGIYFADFNSPYTFGINDKEIFTAASVNKLPIVAVLYWMDSQGKIDLDEKITMQAEDIQAYGTGSLQNQPPGSVYSLKTLAQLSLKESDNTAAHILAKRIGMPYIQKTIDDWGLKQTDMENNKTSAYDMYLLLRRMYNRQVASVANTQELFGFMLDTDIEDRLPALMPDGVNVYHKTGDAIGSINDIGIIQKGGDVFYLGILTADVQDKETQTKQTIAKIAKNIIDRYAQRE